MSAKINAPWKERGMTYFQHLDDFLATMMIIDSNGLFIAAVNHDIDHLGEAHAADKLIAAAPELLEALEVSLNEINELKRALADEIGSNRASVYYQLGSKARAAIAKARGES